MDKNSENFDEIFFFLYFSKDYDYHFDPKFGPNTLNMVIFFDAQSFSFASCLLVITLHLAI